MGKTKLEKYNLLHKFLFDETMADREAYQAMVSILLENEIEILGNPETEKEFRVSPELREVRLDVVAMDAEKTLYYTEMQRRNTGNLLKRSRYYQALLDASLLEPGCKDFNLLNDSCFILIAPFDLFGKGLYRYTFEGVCRECPDLKLNDGAVRIFINTRGKNAGEFSGEFLELMRYIEKSTDETAETLESPRVKRIHERVSQVRKFEKVGFRFRWKCEELDYAREDGEKAGIKKGEQGKLIEQVCKKLSKNKTPEEIAEELEEDPEIILRICRAAKEFAPAYDSRKVCEKLAAVPLEKV